MSPGLANEAELYFERGGPIYRLMQRLTLNWHRKLTAGRRIAGFLMITWAPLFLFALIEGRAFGPRPQESLLQDFGAYARFFLGVPLLILAESVVGPRLTGAGLHFVRGGFVRPEDYPAFDQAIARVAKSRESFWAELVILGLAVTGSWTFTAQSMTGGAVTWRSPATATGPGPGLGISLTSLWFHLVALPILQFFFYRWLWRLFVWCRFLWTVSRLKLDLVATHPDQAGGLGFLGAVHTSLGIFAFAMSAVLSAEVAFLLVFENANIETFKVPFVTLLVVVELTILGPLVMFAPVLARTRMAWMRSYSLLVLRYNRAFHEKWVVGKAPTGEPLLGSADFQSLADLGVSFEYIRDMKAVPFNPRVILQLAVITILPCLPLVLLIMPVGKIVDLLSGAVF